MLALSTMGDVVVGYILTAVTLVVVAWRIIASGRKLGRQIADEDKPWI